VQTNGTGYGLQRFTEAQRVSYARALSEIKAGRKTTCWMWFVIPTPPHIVNGIEKGSAYNRKYALRSDEEGRAYLNYRHDGVDLRSNYIEIMRAVRDQLQLGKKVSSLVGHFDGPKLVSSVQFFERIARCCGDDELRVVMDEVLELIDHPVSPPAVPSAG
jgi:uncharacterized protein (DUF1810 family)